MKPINILILDDNTFIANKIRRRLINADKTYRYDSGIEIIPHYLEIDNENIKNAAITVNNFIKENDVKNLLLDRGFGTIFKPVENNDKDLDCNYLYKDNNKSGFYIEELLLEISKIKKNGLTRINGVVVYTYDDYKDLNKHGDVIKEDIIYELKSILSNKCKIDVLLAYSDIYKLASVDLYEDYGGDGIVKIGKANDFYLYGIFCGELLYHKLIQMINSSRMNFIKERKTTIFLRLFFLYLIFISISVGSNAVFNYLFVDNFCNSR